MRLRRLFAFATLLIAPVTACTIYFNSDDGPPVALPDAQPTLDSDQPWYSDGGGGIGSPDAQLGLDGGLPWLPDAPCCPPPPPPCDAAP